MKPPTKSPDGQRPPPSSNRGIDEPQSGRARKDVNYVPVPSASLRAKPPLPSASMQPAAPAEEPTFEDDLIEDLATPTRAPNLATPQPSPVIAPPPSYQQPQAPIPTGPFQPIAPPPSSQRHFTPPPSQQSMSASPMHAASSARVRQVTPMDAAPYSSPYPSQQGPASQQQITGPQMPVAMHPNTGSFPAAGRDAPASRPGQAPEEGVPLGYVVASAFFLAIALVGFGLYLAFEVISL